MGKRLLYTALAVFVVLAGCVENPPAGPTTTTLSGGIESGRAVSAPLSCDQESMRPKAAEYLVLLPKVIFSGAASSASVTAVSKLARQPVKSCVKFSLLSDRTGKSVELATASTGDDGHFAALFEIPDIEAGAYRFVAEVLGGGETFEGSVTVRQNPALFIETDKPIYKPGQTIRGRVLTLDNGLKPVSLPVEVEVMDAKGIKVYRRNGSSDAFGAASFDLPLASDVNFGTWKIYATSASSKTTLDVRVEKYVLPKFKVGLSTPRDWYLAGDEIAGSVSADYFFGKKVDGEVKVEAYKYVGEWVRHATYAAALKDGSADFTIPAAGYVAGTPGAGGQGSLMLNVTVADTAGHLETTSKLLKITQSPVVLQLIPEGRSVKPGIPFQLIAVTQSPDDRPVDKAVKVSAVFKDLYLDNISTASRTLDTENGLVIFSLNPPANTYAVEVHAEVEGVAAAKADVALQSVYSPSSTFIHIVQASKGAPKPGETADFLVYSTSGGRIYYDVVASGRTAYSGSTSFQRSGNSTIKVPVTVQMAPEAKLVAYKINPDSEVSADSLPFKVEMAFPVDLKAGFNASSSSAGGDIAVSFDAGGKSLIGVSIVDESVYALNEGRLNMQQVFAELEKRFMEPQAEAHPVYQHIYDFEETMTPRGVLKESGMQAIGSEGLVFPEGKKPDYSDYYKIGDWRLMRKGGWAHAAGGVMVEKNMAFEDGALPQMAVAGSVREKEESGAGGLAEPQRVRQFFPETWLWNPKLLTDDAGKASLTLTVPDSITTWRLHAVSSSPDGLGMAESKLVVFQDFFVEPDLPYSVTRGEEFPVSVLVYNYLDAPQTVRIDMGSSDWYDLLSDGTRSVEVPANSVSSASFKIRPKKLGVKTVDVTARTAKRADSVKREIIVEAEGVQREAVENGILKAGGEANLEAALPDAIIPDSGKLVFTTTPSVIAQSIAGVDNLLGMPYGCGEQNMMLFAPDVEIMRYLDASGQANPEVQAKAEVFTQTGYQRELTYRHSDGSFSAFGDRDGNGSLWLTSFVLHTFASARDQIEVDEGVLSKSAGWISGLQRPDGSFEPYGFVIHRDMMGGLGGNYAHTAYVALALDEYGGAGADTMAKAKRYLEDKMDGARDDPYAMAVGSLALLKLKSGKADAAVDALLKLAKNDENGLYWGSDPVILGEDYGPMRMPPRHSGRSVENTAYAALALMEARRGEANKAVSWIVAQRNSRGGFESTQDTVLAFRVLAAAAKGIGRDVDAKVVVEADGRKAGEFRVDSGNYDVLQALELPTDTRAVSLRMEGKGEVNYQLVRKFNVPANLTRPSEPDIELAVAYDSDHVAVNDVVEVDCRVKYVGKGDSSGMMIVDVAVPTGFAPVEESIDALLAKDKRVPKVEVAGRKIIVYVDDLPRGEEFRFRLQVRARFPVKAVIPSSSAYSYYEPSTKAETAGGLIEAA
jgi:CD109 antigen